MNQLHLNTLRFTATPYMDGTGIRLTARTIAHTECFPANWLNTLNSEGDAVVDFQINGVPMCITSKGWDCNWDATCPFCGERVTSGEEVIFGLSAR